MYLQVNDTVIMKDLQFPLATIIQLTEKGAYVLKLPGKTKQFVELDNLMINQNAVTELVSRDIRIGDSILCKYRDEQNRTSINNIESVLLATSKKYTLVTCPSWVGSNGKIIVLTKDLVKKSHKIK